MIEKLLKGIGTLVLIIIVSFNLHAQTHTPVYASMTGFSNGYYEYLPQGYWNNPDEKFPVIIFVHGIGECGNGTTDLNRVLANGTPRQINQGTFPASFNVGGQNFKFIVITPQFTNWVAYIQMNDVINYVVSHYKVDVNRIYLTGLSMGGGCIWEYAGYSYEYAARVAAIVPVCGASSATTDKINNIANADLPIWATHNAGDGTVGVASTITYVDGINNAPNPPTPLAKKTIFQVSGHDAWTQTYDLNFRENGLNVYEWMLTNKRNVAALPVTGLNFSATKRNNASLLQWSTQTETNNRGFAIERSSDGINYSPITFINSTSINGNGASYQYTDLQPAAGKNYYRIKQVDINDRFSYSTVKILDFTTKMLVQVYPNPASDFIYIRNPVNSSKTIARLMNGSGQLVKQMVSGSQNGLDIPLANIPSGIYYLQLETGGIKETHKISVKK